MPASAANNAAENTNKILLILIANISKLVQAAVYMQ